MPRHLPLNQLRAFEAAARLVSFRAAATELALTPSAISHAVRELERVTGIPLFQRTSRRVELTPEGAALFHHVARGFDELRLGVDVVAAEGPGLLRLHCAPSFAAKWLAPRLGQLLEHHPTLEVKLAANQDYPLFPSTEFDADIVYGEPRQPGLVVEPLGVETIAPLCTPALAARIGSLGDLAAMTLIESEHNRVRWPSWFELNGRPCPTASGPRFDRSFLAILVATEGLGVALESTRLAQRELARGQLVQPLAGTTKDVHFIAHRLVYPRSGEREGSLRRFRRWLLTALAEGRGSA